MNATVGPLDGIPAAKQPGQNHYRAHDDATPPEDGIRSFPDTARHATTLPVMRHLTVAGLHIPPGSCPIPLASVGLRQAPADDRLR